ncbi:hypothetical protein POTOM_003848 [Populus tomentosa]|uniref:Uncharacterized protein n=1 Tax=Populus tomentosa TaxID=118781 RepID=A0A8X8APB6_POPTO|nr:hypothetical protein POTOM_003848 [Populus tomentosa]
MAIQTSLQLISYSQELVDGQPVHVSSNCLPIKALKYEPAGHAYHSAALKLLGWEEEGTKSEDQKVSKDKEQSYMPSSESYSTKGKKKTGSGDKQQDHYAMLGLGHLRYLATEEQIRKSYREVALKYHPDKQAAILLAEETEAAKQAKKYEIESHFKAIQEAYEALIDPVKRRIYDSTDEFDDEIPTDCSPQDFFKVFGPAFMRNGRWSVNQPIPSLGDDNTPLKEVDSFYDFWYSFKSWREFPHADEFDLEQAESRDHKRWMERQNAKLSEKARKEDYARIRTLVDSAYKRDPRILRRKEEGKAEKQRRKEAKFLAKRLQEEEAARAAEEERRQKEEEEKRAAEAALQQKKLKEKEKKLLRKERSRLRTLSAPVLPQCLLNLGEDDVENLCMSLDIEQLRSLCDRMDGKEVVEQAKVLRDACGCDHDSSSSKLDEKKISQQNGSLNSNGRAPSSSSGKKEKPWSREEIELLRKGIQKYPKGTSRRWEVISEYIGTGRSVEEILKATKTVLLQKPDTAKAFDSFLEKRKPAQSIASPLTTREEIQGASAMQAPENRVAKIAEEESSRDTDKQKTDDVVTANGVSSSADQDMWSAVQERALVQALKTFPKETSQRWERVAAAVPGKTANQCRKKLALLKENFRSKKRSLPGWVESLGCAIMMTATGHWIFIPTCIEFSKQNKACLVSAVGVCVRTTGRVSKWICSLHLDPWVECGEKTPVIADSRHNEYKWLFVHESDYNIKEVGTSNSLISGEKSTELPNRRCYKSYFCYAVEGVRDDYLTECPRDAIILFGALHQVNNPSTLSFTESENLLGYRFKVESRSMFGVNPKFIAEVSKRKEEYINNVEVTEIAKQCEKEQIEFLVEVRAGPNPKELALKAAKNFRATWVVLDNLEISVLQELNVKIQSSPGRQELLELLDSWRQNMQKLITGLQTADKKLAGKSLVGWARPLLKERNYPDLIDERILESHDVHQLFWMVRVAEKCLSKDPQKRLTMTRAGISNSSLSLQAQALADFCDQSRHGLVLKLCGKAFTLCTRLVVYALNYIIESNSTCSFGELIPAKSDSPSSAGYSYESQDYFDTSSTAETCLEALLRTACRPVAWVT